MPPPHAPRPTPHQRVQAGHRPSPAGYCHPPTPELTKTERGPISTSGLSISVCHRIGRSLQASQSFPPRSPPLNRGAEWATYFLPQGKHGWPQRPRFTGTGRACGKEKSRKPEFSERNGPPTFSHPGNAGGPYVTLGTVLTVHARRLKLHAPCHPRPGMAKSRCRSTYRPWFTGDVFKLRAW